MNSFGDMARGFHGSKGTEHIGAFFSGRRASGSTVSKPVLIQAGRDYFEHERFGDYSYTTPDPSNGSFWTIQQYVERRSNPSGLPEEKYGLSVSQINP